MSRTSICFAMVLGVLTVAIPDSVPITGSGMAEGVQVANLQERLEKDLKARLPSHFAFIAKVVDLTRNDVLPLAVVNSTHLWARKKSEKKFQYFEAAMRVRAARLGITL